MKTNCLHVLLVLALAATSGCDLSTGSKVTVKLNNVGSHSYSNVHINAHKHLDLGDFSQFVATCEDLGTVAPHATNHEVEVSHGYTMTFYCETCGPVDAAYDISGPTTIDIP